MTPDEGAIRTWAMRDGARLHYRHYSAAQPKGAVVAIHGIQSHGGWYEASCSAMASAGYEVYFLDRRGSGLNRYGRGDVSDYRVFVDDLREVLVEVRRRAGGKPVHLEAISWGSKLACATLILHPELADSLMLLGPALVPRVDVSLADKLRVAASLLVNPTRLFDVPLNDARLFTANPERIAYIEQDELSLRRCTARFLYQTRRLDRFVRRSARRMLAPALLMLAGHDPIVDNDAVRQLFEEFASPRKTAIMYDDAHHTLEFEPDPKPIFEAMVRWLDGFSPSPSARGLE
jgi:alpha-beta hydrolase superfamily lysophospholipase